MPAALQFRRGLALGSKWVRDVFFLTQVVLLYVSGESVVGGGKSRDGQGEKSKCDDFGSSVEGLSY